MVIITLISYFLPVIALFFRFKTNKQVMAGFFVFYLLYSLLNDVAVGYMPVSSMSYLMLAIFTIVEYVLFASFLHKVLRGSYVRKSLIGISILFVAFLILRSFTHFGNTFDTLPASIESLIILFYCVVYFFEQIKQPTSLFLYNEKEFWIVCGFMIYSACSFFIFLLSSQLSEGELNKYWIIARFGNILKNLLFAVAFFIKPNSHTKDESYPFSKSYEL